MKFQIRKYLDQDREQVEKIFLLSKKIEMSFSGIEMKILSFQEDEKMNQLFENSEIVVAEVDGNVIGFAGNKENLISFLFVNPKYFKKGVGKRLLDFYFYCPNLTKNDFSKN